MRPRRVRAAAAWLLCLALCLGAFEGALAADREGPEITRLRAALKHRPRDEALRKHLGDALFRDGRALASMVVLNPGRRPDASWVPDLRKAAAVYSEVGRPEAAARALRSAVTLAPDDPDLLQDLAAARQAAGRDPSDLPTAAAEPDPDAGALADPGAEAEPPAAAGPPARAAPLRAIEPAAAAPPAEDGPADPAPPSATRPARRLAPPPHARRAAAVALAAAVVALLVLGLRLLRGRGDVAVAIEMPPGRRGTFSVRLAKKRELGRRPDAHARPETRASSRFEHNLIARETHFRGIPARRYWVVIEGVLEADDGSDREAVRLDQEVHVAKGHTARAAFDLRPAGCPVEVRLVHGEEPMDGRVALGGDPTSVRLARGGIARLTLPEGDHVVLVGARDRGAERSLAISGLDPLRLTVDLADGEGLAFQGCEAAVEPFLRGDLSVAATALERAGQKERADLLLARFHQSRGSNDSAAERFEAVGRFLEAGELRAEAGEHQRAALLFERAGDLGRAGEAYRASGDLLRAGRAFEEAGELDAAVACYREVEAPRLLDALEKRGDAFEAGQLALARTDVSRATRNLQQVDARSPHYVEACRTLASLFSEQGRLELAVQKADEAITFSRPDETSADTFVWYGNLLARAGRPDRALEVFEELSERSPEHPGVLARVESLRREISQRAKETTATESLPLASPFGESSRYEILDELGSGGMGIVFRARDRRLGREVALKRLPDNLKDHPRAVDLFLREARAAAALNHPNIVTVHDVDQENGLFFITMELLVGSPLSEVLSQHGRLRALDAVRIGGQVATGLAYAHAQRIIHRDVKTANLFLTQDRVVKIMDFGLAKMLEEVRRATTVIGGTPYYMAPEQAAGEQVDARADLYALGVTLFELVCGRRPFEEGDVTYHHRHTPAPDPRSLGAELPDALAELILRMMAKQPGDRPPSAERVGQQLKQIADALRR